MRSRSLHIVGILALVGVVTVIALSSAIYIRGKQSFGLSPLQWSKDRPVADSKILEAPPEPIKEEVEATTTIPITSATELPEPEEVPESEEEPEPAPKCDNPYAHPGYMWYSSLTEETNTTWVPFYSGMLDLPVSSIVDEDGKPVDPVMNGQPYYPKDYPPQELLDTAPHPWMQDIVRYNDLVNRTKQGKKMYKNHERELKKLEDDLSWLRNRVVLLVSDSVDRYQSEYICNRVGEVLVSGKKGRQTTAVCHIPLFNLTFYNWHVASVSTTRPDWWWIKDMDIVTIEDRWKNYYRPSVKQTIGTNGVSPDLIMIQSSLWDHTFFVNAPQTAKGKIDFSRSLTWREMRFYMQRFRYLIQSVRDEYGYDVPIFCRATTYKKSMSNLSIHDLDRASRFVCHEMGLEMMEFGKINQAFYTMYKDMVHVARGPTSVLWANMVFGYLFRALGGVEYKGKIIEKPPAYEVNRTEEWNKCHDYFMDRQYDY